MAGVEPATLPRFTRGVRTTIHQHYEYHFRVPRWPCTTLLLLPLGLQGFTTQSFWGSSI